MKFKKNCYPCSIKSFGTLIMKLILSNFLGTRYKIIPCLLLSDADHVMKVKPQKRKLFSFFFWKKGRDFIICKKIRWANEIKANSPTPNYNVGHTSACLLMFGCVWRHLLLPINGGQKTLVFFILLQLANPFVWEFISIGKMSSKALVLIAVFLFISSEVAAGDLAETSTEQKSSEFGSSIIYSFQSYYGCSIKQIK